MAATLTGKEIFFFSGRYLFLLLRFVLALVTTRCAFHLENLFSENKMQCKTYLGRIFFATSVLRWRHNALSLQKRIYNPIKHLGQSLLAKIVLVVSYFRKKAPSQMFGMVLDAPLFSYFYKQDGPRTKVQRDMTLLKSGVCGRVQGKIKNIFDKAFQTKA